MASYKRETSEWSGDFVPAVTAGEFKALVGRSPNGYDLVQGYNGDYAANQTNVDYVTWYNSGNFWAHCTGGSTTPVRINVYVTAFDFD